MSVRMPRPTPRGPLSETLLEALAGEPHPAATRSFQELVREWHGGGPSSVARDEDVQLTLTCLYELHHQGIHGVDDRWEWDPGLLSARTLLESAFEAELREAVPVPDCPSPDAATVASVLFGLTAPGGKPGLAAYLAKRATLDQAREFLVHRSVYQLKEADPHTWAIPRLAGAPKAALVEIQADEYGGGDPARMHSALFARTMRGAGLDDSYGRYIDDVPALTLAGVTMMTMFGLHRRLRGAIAGHLAAFEMTSSIPNRLYGNGFRRLGHDAQTTDYFDEHVEADAVHEQIAGRDLAGRLAEAEPGLLTDILFGAAACLTIDDWLGEHVLASWRAGESSLRTPAMALS